MAKVLVVAAEASGASFARGVLECWKKRNIQAFGVGSKSMEALGFEALARVEDMCVVGFFEVLGKYRFFRQVFYKILQRCEEEKPSCALLIDYPGFNLRLAGELKKRGIPVVYFVGPQIWAWKSERIHKIKRSVDEMLVIFPFEEKVYREHHVPVQFVGHPLVEEWQKFRWSAEERSMARRRFGVADDDVFLGIYPGSRPSEIFQHLSVQIETVRRCLEKVPKIKVGLAVADSLDRKLLTHELEKQVPDFSVRLIDMEPFHTAQLFDVALVKSGTGTLVLGLASVPMVVLYRMNPLSAWLAKQLVKVKYFSLVNLVLEEEVAPEFFQGKAVPDILAKELLPLLVKEPPFFTQRARLQTIEPLLGDMGAVQKVADRVLERVL